jgi:hypothetical protein
VTTAPALDALLAGLVDYAGLFPPAALPMGEAAVNYANYRRGAHRAMLGRFVVPAARLGELGAAVGAMGQGAHHAVSLDGERLGPWRIAALASAAEGDLVAGFNEKHRGRLAIDTIETKAEDLPGIWRAAAAFDKSFTVYVEIPVEEDPSPLVQELATRGMRAKIRTGGVTTGAFPAPAAVLRFLSVCAHHGVPIKATAGLHHPLRGEYPLTYATDAERGTMYGFLNVFLAAALLYDGVEAAAVAPLLEERDPAAIVVGDDAISWGAHHVTRDEIARARAGFAGSFGSCSFEEPVRDLAALHLLPA